MTDTPNTLKMPNGSSFTIIESTTDSSGTRIEFEATLPAQTEGPPAHFHPKQHEGWRVLDDGELTLTIDGEQRTLASGEELTITPGTVHTFANRGTTPNRFRDIHTPALDFQQYMETLDRLTRAGKLTDHRGPSSLIYGAMVLYRHRATQLSANRAQRVAETLLAQLGHALRYTID
jgi:mannose-6-phosphate isomerase-like protein (cupin superfamily)